jgi:hypothetical protein
VHVPVGGLFAWALMDRRTGKVWGYNWSSTTWTASMIKPWLAADWLRLAVNRHHTPTSSELYTLEIMIRDSDNNAAQATYLNNGGEVSIQRLISICKLVDTTASAAGWSFTSISARDTVKMANCIADGTATGTAYWTDWLLRMMREVRGDGDFGIREAFSPAERATIAIKNGWLNYTDDNNWHINCMAVTSTWALAVLQRFPESGPNDIGFSTAQNVCTEVAEQLKNPAYTP